MGKEATLTYKHASGNDCIQKLTGSAFHIGRLDDNDLAFDNPYISRYHVELFKVGAEFHLRDLGSTSGTYVNGEQISEQLLKDGDFIRLGRGRGIEFVYHAGAPDEADEEADYRAISLRPVRVITPENTRFLDTSKLRKSGELTDETLDRLRALYEFTSEILSAHSIDELTNSLIAFLGRTLKAERYAILLHDRVRNKLEVAATEGVKKDVEPSHSITDLVYSEHVAVLSFDAMNDDRFAGGNSIRFQTIHSVMCAPMGSQAKPWGVCYVDNVTAERAFDDEDLDFLAAVSRQAGLAMENLYLLEEQRRSLESFMRTLAASLDARDDTTAGHSARVGVVAQGIAREMGLGPAVSRLAYYAGLLHDYGKIGVRDDVLLKPAELTAEEYEHVKQHPLTTFRLLSKIRFPEELAEIPFVAAAHHERWDGTGYPHGLRGEEIPIVSRIIAVADAYDAVTEQRSYNEPLDSDQAFCELEGRSGTYFDPEVIVAFQRHLKQEIEPRNRRLEERKAIQQP
jgi:HD-GYP domain-containing protein (c-di-GMP phosphodiesterase class II)